MSLPAAMHLPNLVSLSITNNCIVPYNTECIEHTQRYKLIPSNNNIILSHWHVPIQKLRKTREHLFAHDLTFVLPRFIKPTITHVYWNRHRRNSCLQNTVISTIYSASSYRFKAKMKSPTNTHTPHYGMLQKDLDEWFWCWGGVDCANVCNGKAIVYISIVQTKYIGGGWWEIFIDKQNQQMWLSTSINGMANVIL